jgi:hypothetical protein
LLACAEAPSYDWRDRAFVLHNYPGVRHNVPSFKIVLLLGATIALGACAHHGEFDQTGGLKIVRSVCPAVAVPAYTGDVTLFAPPTSQEAGAIDVTATLTNLRNTCNDGGETGTRVHVDGTFQVEARRSDASTARQVSLPYFVTVTRGGTQIVSKQIGTVVIDFPAGQMRAVVTGTATADISRAEATLPPRIQERLNRKRKAGDADAAIDPMNEPAVRAAVKQASFEMLVGFQLTQDQLAYNARR